MHIRIHRVYGIYTTVNHLNIPLEMEEMEKLYRRDNELYIRYYYNDEEFMYVPLKKSVYMCDGVIYVNDYPATGQLLLEAKKICEERKEASKLRSREYSAKYYQENKEQCLLKKKQYREENKDKIKESSKQYREKNKDKIKEYKSQKFECECGGSYTVDHKADHFRTKKHQEYNNKK